MPELLRYIIRRDSKYNITIVMYEESGAYLISRSRRSKSTGRSGGGGGGRRSGGGRGAAGLLILVLLLLTAGICALVIFLPRLTGEEKSDAKAFGGKTFYMLSTGETDDFQTAAAYAKDAAGRGGAGYVYNDGSYHAIAAVYARESEAKALAAANENAYYFKFAFPSVSCGDNDRKALDCLCGEWFNAVYDACASLDRGLSSEAEADFAVRKANSKLRRLGAAAESAIVADAVARACEYDMLDNMNRSVLSYLRFFTVRALVEVHTALTLGA